MLLVLSDSADDARVINRRDLLHTDCTAEVIHAKVTIILVILMQQQGVNEMQFIPRGKNVGMTRLELIGKSTNSNNEFMSVFKLQNVSFMSELESYNFI